MAASMVARVKGSLVGGVVGDCLGAVFEGLWVPGIKIERVISLIHKVEKEKDHPKDQRKSWQYTDDTAMARSVAASLINNNKFDAKDMAKMFTEEFMSESDRGYGSGVVTVFRCLQECDYLDVYGPSKRQFDGSGSYGNGGAMRISPAALFAYKQQYCFDELKELVEGITRITHSHIGAIHGAILQCLAVNVALQTNDLDINVFINSLLQRIQPLEEEWQKSQDQETRTEGVAEEKMKEEAEETYTEKLEQIRKYVTQDELPSTQEINKVLGTDISALRSVPTAVYAFLRATKEIPELTDRNGFERTIIYAISLGGDTDTIATMAGAIAGAYYGVDDIPSIWQDCCEGVDRALEFGQGLHAL